jgi:hypothetical protein
MKDTPRHIRLVIMHLRSSLLAMWVSSSHRASAAREEPGGKSPFPHTHFLAPASVGAFVNGGAVGVAASCSACVEEYTLPSHSLHGLAPPTTLRPPQSRVPHNKNILIQFLYSHERRLSQLSRARLTLVNSGFGRV